MPELREEQAGDEAAIRAVTDDAFRGKPYADGDEADVVDRLRASGALELSLVATEGETILGQASFSPAQALDGSGPWFALGPISITPSRQGQGIGAALIEAGVAILKGRGALGIILTGNPAYYERVGFERAPTHAPPREPSEFFMVRLLAGGLPEGHFSFHPAFYDDE